MRYCTAVSLRCLLAEGSEAEDAAISGRVPYTLIHLAIVMLCRACIPLLRLAWCCAEDAAGHAMKVIEALHAL